MESMGLESFDDMSVLNVSCAHNSHGDMSYKNKGREGTVRYV